MLVKGSYEVDWNKEQSPPSLRDNIGLVDVCDSDRGEILLRCDVAQSGVNYYAGASDGSVLEGTISCVSVHRGELLAVKKVLSVYGCNIALHTTSTYVCNVWIDRWVADNYTTTKSHRVCNMDVICELVSIGCLLVECVPVSSMGHIG
jgi:hypothetical protein